LVVKEISGDESKGRQEVKSLDRKIYKKIVKAS